MQSTIQRQTQLPPEVSKILFVKQLPFKITPEELYDLFGRYGAIRQIRVGNTPATKGKAFVVYEDIFDARVALEKLNGYNVGGRYLVLTYHKPSKVTKEGENSAATARAAVQKSREEVQAIKDKYGV